ncbi:MAG: hypothetical protein AB1941_28270 [Gemmatimonadota bacterium]
MRPTRPLAAAAALALAACSPDLPTTAAPDGGAAPLAAVAAAAPLPVCLEFGPPPPVGAQWGAPFGHPPGTLMFVEAGVPVRIDRFFYPTTTVYNFARIDVSPVPIGAGQQILTDRSTLRFDFTGVPFPVASVTWEWYDPGAGGTLENMAVNGGPIFIGDITAPAAVSGHPYATGWGLAGTGRRGRSQITGPVTHMLLGGERLWVDRVCANP